MNMLLNFLLKGMHSVKTGLIAIAECLHFAGMFFPNKTGMF